MEQNIENIRIPNYIAEEIEEYTKLTEIGKCKCMKWENIKSLLRLAVVSKRITDEEAVIIENTYSRE